MDIAVSEGWLFLYGAQTWNERCWEFVRGDARGGAGGDRAGGVCAARICAVDGDGSVGRAAGGHGGGSVSKYGDARRVSHVGGDDELWRAGVGDGSEWVSVRLGGSGEREEVAGDAGGFSGVGGEGGGGGGVSGVSSGCVPDQSVRTGGEAVVAPGQG